MNAPQDPDHTSGDELSDLAERQRLQRLATRLHSACSATLARIVDETDGIVELLQPVTSRHHSKCRYLTEDELYEALIGLEMFAPPIDIRGNVRDQVASQMRVWAAELLQKADALERGPEEHFTGEPKCYILREILSGTVISETYSYGAAAIARDERSETSDTRCEIVSAPLAEFPRVQAAFEKQCQNIPPLKSPWSDEEHEEHLGG